MSDAWFHERGSFPFPVEPLAQVTWGMIIVVYSSEQKEGELGYLALCTSLFLSVKCGLQYFTSSEGHLQANGQKVLRNSPPQQLGHIGNPPNSF